MNLCFSMQEARKNSTICPKSQVIDNVIQNVTSTAFRVIGRVVLQSGALGIGGGGGGGGGSSSGGSRVSVVLPTFGPDDDDYDDEEEESNNLVASSSTTEASSSSPTTTTTTTTTTTSSSVDNADINIRIDDKRNLLATSAEHISDTAPYTVCNEIQSSFFFILFSRPTILTAFGRSIVLIVFIEHSIMNYDSVE